MLKLLLLAAAAAATTQPLVAEMQRVETSRNAAIKAGDMAALGKLYAPEFHGLAASGQVSTGTLYSASLSAMRAVTSSLTARFSARVA